MEHKLDVRENNGWSLPSQSRWAIYGVLNLLFPIVLVVGSGLGGGSLAELPYVTLLLALCSSPILLIERFNGPFAMLGVTMAVYYMTFGLLDAVSMLSPASSDMVKDATLDGGELVIVGGALMQLVGFYAASRLATTASRPVPPKDWSPRVLLPVGLLVWTMGSAATLYQDLVVQVESSTAAVVTGFGKLGTWNTSGLMLAGNYAGPLGVVILGYWWATSRRRGSTLLILAIIFAQFAIGWVEDSKEAALKGVLVVLLTAFVVRGRLPMRWVIGSILGVILIFPVMTAKRAIMTETLHLTRAQALSHSVEIFWRAIAERNAGLEGKFESKTQTFLERVTAKGSVELFVEHAGKDHPYRLGSTLEPLLYVFFPRVLWSDKPSDNSAQTFNREYHLSEDRDTYMSPSHLGELYWNFGPLGTVLGMGIVGMVLGFVCTRFDLSAGMSLTSVLVIMVTLYELVTRIEGQIEIQYVLWLRTMVLIGILHRLLAKPVEAPEPPIASNEESRGRALAPNIPLPNEPIRFPNLLR